MDTDAEIIEEWLGAVNRPVVEVVEESVCDMLREISDGGNFTPEQCKRILRGIVSAAPNC